MEDVLVLLLWGLLRLDYCLGFKQLLLVLLLVALSQLHGLMLRERLLQELLAAEHHGDAFMRMAAAVHCP